MRTPQINAALELTITRPRLDKYLNASGNDLDLALGLYERNAKLSEAFYTPLQCLEICLRNRINAELSTAFGADWFQNGNPHLEPDALVMIQKALAQLAQDKKAPINGAVVAELSFGFWISLLGARYDGNLWRTSLYKAFVYQGKALARKRVHGRLNALRRFRNRIAHHEPIFYRPLQVAHDEIVESIAWLSPETSAWTAAQSRFTAVFAAP